MLSLELLQRVIPEVVGADLYKVGNQLFLGPYEVVIDDILGSSPFSNVYGCGQKGLVVKIRDLGSEMTNNFKDQNKFLDTLKLEYCITNCYILKSIAVYFHAITATLFTIYPRMLQPLMFYHPNERLYSTKNDRFSVYTEDFTTALLVALVDFVMQTSNNFILTDLNPPNILLSTELPGQSTELPGQSTKVFTGGVWHSSWLWESYARTCEKVRVEAPSSESLDYPLFVVADLDSVLPVNQGKHRENLANTRTGFVPPEFYLADDTLNVQQTIVWLIAAVGYTALTGRLVYYDYATPNADFEFCTLESELNTAVLLNFKLGPLLIRSLNRDVTLRPDLETFLHKLLSED